MSLRILRYPLAAFAAVASLGVVGVARADETPTQRAADAPAPFGARGHLVVGDLIGLHFGPGFNGPASTTLQGIVSYFGQDATGDGEGRATTGWQLTVAPTVDYFVGERFSIGGRVVFGVSSYTYRWVTGPGNDGDAPPTRHETSVDVGLNPRIGYAIPLAEGVTFWPRIGAGVAARQDDGGDYTAVSVEGDAGFVFRLGRYAYVNAGPTLSYAHLKYTAGGTVTNLNGGASGSLGLVF